MSRTIADLSNPSVSFSASAGPRSLARRALDFVYGYDFFISYAWSDGAAYAENLARRLENDGYDVFLDRDDYATGDNWRRVGAWTLRRTGQLLLVGSPNARDSMPVAQELEIFASTGRRIIPIDFAGSLEGLDPSSVLGQHLTPDLLRISESAEALAFGPSEDTLDTIRRTFRIVRQDKKRIQVLTVVAVSLALLAITAAVFWADAAQSKARAQEALSQTEAARAEAVRQRDAALDAQVKERAATLAANSARQDALSQRNLAQRRQLEAERERNAAVQAREAERLARERADLSAREARGQADASAAYILSDRDPTLALRLAARAAESSPNSTADLALLRAYNTGSWFYSNRFQDAVDASLSEDEKSVAWLDGRSLHLLNVEDGSSRQWEDDGSNVLVGTNGNIATWSRGGSRGELGVVKVRTSGGSLIFQRELELAGVFACGRSSLLAFYRFGDPRPSQQAALWIDLETGRTSSVAVPSNLFTVRGMCNSSRGLALIAYREQATLVRQSGAFHAITLPSPHRAQNVAVNAGGTLGVIYLVGGETDALGLIRLDDPTPEVDMIPLPMSPTSESGGTVTFLDENRLLAVSADGWARIVNVNTREVTSLGDQGRAPDLLALSPANGEFAIARRSGRVGLYDRAGTNRGVLLGTLHSDGANVAFSRLEFGNSGNVILSVSQTNGAHLWRRPRLLLTIPADDGPLPEGPPANFVNAVAARSTNSNGIAGLCGTNGGIHNIHRDDANLMYLCIRFAGRVDFLPTLLRDQDIDLEFSSNHGGAIQSWSGANLRRLFILDPSVILEEIRNNSDIWPLTGAQIDQMLDRRR